ncbi:hypothetical protein EVAR_29922_1 [Eumeta japonica]|uniref:Uncharacterized protein n=1 Tax=Eumeta variegata TaxID=151549 RepID=A0A4C1VA31_EUMVA|nr:hypothetical protein EVAR_29922_1 [Eumeta japonica]
MRSKITAREYLKAAPPGAVSREPPGRSEYWTSDRVAAPALMECPGDCLRPGRRFSFNTDPGYFLTLYVAILCAQNLEHPIQERGTGDVAEI